MIINPIYLNSNSNLSNGENDWDPTDIKENKEMLDLTGYTYIKTCSVVDRRLNDQTFAIGNSFDNIFIANNTTLILYLRALANGNYYPCIYPAIRDPHETDGSYRTLQTDYLALPNIILSTAQQEHNYTYCKIKLPSIFNNKAVFFLNNDQVLRSINIVAWYKNE